MIPQVAVFSRYVSRSLCGCGLYTTLTSCEKGTVRTERKGGLSSETPSRKKERKRDREKERQKERKKERKRERERERKRKDNGKVHCEADRQRATAGDIFNGHHTNPPIYPPLRSRGCAVASGSQCRIAVAGQADKPEFLAQASVPRSVMGRVDYVVISSRNLQPGRSTEGSPVHLGPPRALLAVCSSINRYLPPQARRPPPEREIDM